MEREKEGMVVEPGGVEGEKREVRYADIDRPVSLDEVGIVRKAAEEAGLWRFAEAPRHDGFAL